MSRVSGTDARRRHSRRLGGLLRELRKGLGMTQVQVGGRVGVDQVTVRRWELGIFSPSSGNLERLAAVYHVDPSHLLEAARGFADADTTVPMKGYVNAGGASRAGWQSGESITVPAFLARDLTSGFALLVNGGELVSEGFHHNDVVVVDPHSEHIVGRLYVLDVEGSVEIGSPVGDGRFRLSLGALAPIELTVPGVTVAGRLVCHFRRL